MAGLQTATPESLRPAEGINESMFSAFVKWLDRPQSTTRTYIINLRQFATWLRFRGIKAPGRQDIIEYRDWLMSEHDAIQMDTTADGWSYRTTAAGTRVRLSCKPTTAAQYLRSVSQFFSWAEDMGLYPNVARNVHAPKVSHDVHRKDALEPAEVLDIERSIVARAEAKTTAAEGAAKDREGRTQRSTEQGKRLYAMYLLAVTAGLRTVEISRANVRDLEVKGNRAVLNIWGKGHTEPDQRKPLAPEVYEALKTYLLSRKDSPSGQSPLFVSTGNRSQGKRILPTTISTMLKRAMQGAGYDSDKLTAHSLRHTAGTAVQQITGNLYETQKYMRHSNPATTEIYLHTEDEAKESDIAKRLYDLYHQGTSPAEAG